MDLPVLTSNGALPVEHRGGYIYRASDQYNRQLAFGVGGSQIDALPAKTLPVGDFLMLTRTTPQTTTGTFEYLAASGDITPDRFWWSADSRAIYSYNLSLTGFTSGSFNFTLFFKEKDQPLLPGNTPITVQVVAFPTTALVNGARSLSAILPNTLFRACDIGFGVSAVTAALVSPGGCSVRFSIRT